MDKSSLLKGPSSHLNRDADFCAMAISCSPIWLDRGFSTVFRQCAERSFTTSEINSHNYCESSGCCPDFSVTNDVINFSLVFEKFPFRKKMVRCSVNPIAWSTRPSDSVSMWPWSFLRNSNTWSQVTRISLVDIGAFVDNMLSEKQRLYKRM